MIGVLGALCCWLYFGIVPDLRETKRALTAEREALEAMTASRMTADGIARDAAAQITLQQATQLQQIDQLRRTLEDLNRTATRLYPKE